MVDKPILPQNLGSRGTVTYNGKVMTLQDRVAELAKRNTAAIDKTYKLGRKFGMNQAQQAYENLLNILQKCANGNHHTISQGIGSVCAYCGLIYNEKGEVAEGVKGAAEQILTKGDELVGTMIAGYQQAIVEKATVKQIEFMKMQSIPATLAVFLNDEYATDIAKILQYFEQNIMAADREEQLNDLNSAASEMVNSANMMQEARKAVAKNMAVNPKVLQDPERKKELEELARSWGVKLRAK